MLASWKESKKESYDKHSVSKRQRHHLANKDTKIQSKLSFFPVVMYRYESWTLKKAEHQRIDAFEMWCWEDSQESLGLQGDKSVNPKGNQP